MKPGPGQVAGGCDGGTPTVEGIGVSAVLAIGAIAFATAATIARRRMDRA